MSLTVLLFAAGCVTRSLAIKTDPPGAKVYLNDALIGESPLTHDFVWYGWYRVMIRKEGYQRFDDRKLLRAPVYCWIPMDLAMELLPFRIRDARTWSYTLIPSPKPPIPTPPPTTEPGDPPQAGGRGSPAAAGGGTEPENPAEGGGTQPTQEPSDAVR